jgi:4-amino-4-deoxy-L-arabinose transferase-like glycosyltransferase
MTRPARTTDPAPIGRFGARPPERRPRHGRRERPLEAEPGPARRERSEQPAPARRPAAARLRFRVALGAVCALHLALLLAWSVLVPTFRAPDEHVHHDMARYLTTTWRYPAWDGLDVSERTLAALSASPVFFANRPPGDGDAATPRGERPGWADLGPDVRDDPPNQMPQHPPLYYLTAGAALRVIDGDGERPLDRVVWELRLLSVLAMAALPLLAVDIARRVGASDAAALAAAVAAAATPQLTHVGAAVSNDPLLVLLGGLTLAGAARLATGDQRWPVAVATGVLAGLSLFTKGFAVPIAVAVGVACLTPLVTRRRDPDRPAPAAVLARAAVVAGLALVLGGWWWVRNFLTEGTPQPGVRLRDRVPDVEIDHLRFAGDFGERLVTSTWGNFGWFEARLPLWVSIGVTIVVVVAGLVACWRALPRVFLAVGPAFAGGMVLSAAWGAFKKTGVAYATHGRYAFAGAAGLAALVAIGFARLAGRRGRVVPLVMLAGALGLQAVGMWVALGTYWAGEGPVARLRSMAAFAPVPGTVTAAILVLLAASTAAATFTIWWWLADGDATTEPR